MQTLKWLAAATALVGALAGASPKALAHCEIPCGIYGDAIRERGFLHGQKRTHFELLDALDDLNNAKVSHLQAIVDYQKRERRYGRVAEDATKRRASAKVPV